MQMDGCDFSGKKFVVLNAQRNRGLAMVGFGVQSQYAGAATNASIFSHADFCRHRQRDLYCLAFGHRKGSSNQRSTGAEIECESVSYLSIWRTQNHRHLILFKAMTASPFNP